MRKFLDLTNQKFNRLEVKDRSHVDKWGQWHWKCLCDCGKLVTVKGTNIRSGSTKSCGCLNKELCASGKHRTHSLSKTRLYSIYHSMIQRCYNENSTNYSSYGGRGIVVCDSWLLSFKTFYDWAINNGYSKDLTLDRKGNDGNYTPENCRWATRVEQTNNMRNNHNITFGGETLSLSQWAKRLEINTSGLYQRLKRWGLERALTTPKKKL